MIALVVVVALLALQADAFTVQTGMRAAKRGLYMSDEKPPTAGKAMNLDIKKPKATGAGFNYDPSNYKDSANEGNYRRLSDQQAAIKAENDKLAKEREELIRQEKMAKMMLKAENETFWNTPGDTVVATSEKFFVPPSVIAVIDDLDNQVSLSNFTCHKHKALNYLKDDFTCGYSLTSHPLISFLSSTLPAYRSPTRQGQDEKIRRTDAFPAD